ncbi:hypothetical protein ES705_28242 [subsurface metagenome]
MDTSSVTTKKNRTSVLKSQDDSPSHPSSSGGHGDTVGVASNTLEAGGCEGLSDLEAEASSTLAQELDADGGVGGSLLDTYATSRRKASSYLGGSKNLDNNRRVRRFYQRYFTGVGVGGRLRILSLTSSDEAVCEGYDIHRDFEVLKKRLRRRWGSFEYIGVKEVKDDREHLHLVFRGSYMEQVQLSAMWASIHKSPVVDVRHIYSWVRRDGHKVKVWNNPKGGARYLAKYLAKEAVNRYWASYNWVFSGWVGWSKRVKRALGHYPSKALLQSLARLDKVKRWLAMDFLEWQYPTLWQARLDEVNRGRLCGQLLNNQ